MNPVYGQTSLLLSFSHAFHLFSSGFVVESKAFLVWLCCHAVRIFYLVGLTKDSHLLLQEPSAAAKQAMKRSDDAGYKAPTQMLDEQAPAVNVWQQIGAQEPSVAANDVMQENDKVGY